jgi:hypothetical protein
MCYLKPLMKLDNYNMRVDTRVVCKYIILRRFIQVYVNQLTSLEQIVLPILNLRKRASNYSEVPSVPLLSPLLKRVLAISNSWTRTESLTRRSAPLASILHHC